MTRTNNIRMRQINLAFCAKSRLHPYSPRVTVEHEMKLLKTIPRVLVLMPTVQKACRDKLQGVLRYARRNGPWDVQTFDGHPFNTQLGALRNWKPDGVIYGNDPNLPPFPHLCGVVGVRMDSPLKDTLSSVRHSSRLIAEAAAEHLLQLGLSRFGFVGSVPASGWSETRAVAFAARLAQAGYTSQTYASTHPEDWGLEQPYMRAWLESLPKPCGLMVAMDLRAKQVLDTCLASGLRVPEDICVVGVDNDETVCENTTPTLSSVLPDFEEGGYLAAELLDRQMRGLTDKPSHLQYGVKQVVQRGSSLFVPHSGYLLSSALEFIRLNVCAGIRVADVVAHMNVSRRQAERHFRTICGCSILDEIQRRRLEQVCKLLRETRMAISEIGTRCGYGSEVYLKVLFKKRHGMTMRDYRKAYGKKFTDKR